MISRLQSRPRDPFSRSRLRFFKISLLPSRESDFMDFSLAVQKRADAPRSAAAFRGNSSGRESARDPGAPRRVRHWRGVQNENTSTALVKGVGVKPSVAVVTLAVILSRRRAFSAEGGDPLRLARDVPRRGSDLDGGPLKEIPP